MNAPAELRDCYAEWNAAYREAFAEAVTGCDEVWDYPRPKWGEEKFLDIMAALKFALRRPGITHEELGRAVDKAVREIANDYASHKADEAVETEEV